MKFMLNGALTIGTMDGANVEMVEEMGEENAFIFGMSAEEVIAHENNRDYDPMEIFNTNADVRKVLLQLVDGTFSKTDSELFRRIYDSLLNTNVTEKADTYFILKDFDSYKETQQQVEEAYKDGARWAKMAMLNVANVGKFSSDRTIEEYAKEIWNLKKIKVDMNIQ